MANLYSLNNNPATGPVAIWTAWTLLSSAGWTKIADSDGTTYSSSGAQVTGGGTGTHGFGNSNAWMVLRDPSGSGGRQYCIQRSSDTNYRVKYSPTAGFTGGSPGATQTPSATDQVILIGGGTDAAPTFTVWLASNATYRFHGVASNTSAYGFAIMAYPVGGGTPSFAWVHDPLVSGTYPSGDTDPLVVYCPINSSSVFTSGGVAGEVATTGPVAMLSGGIVQVSGFIFCSQSGGNNQAIPSDLGTNSWNGDDEGFPIFYGRRTALGAPAGSKGLSSMMRWAGVSRSTGDTANSKAKIYIGAVLLPWDGATVPQV